MRDVGKEAQLAGRGAFQLRVLQGQLPALEFDLGIRFVQFPVLLPDLAVGIERIDQYGNQQRREAEDGQRRVLQVIEADRQGVQLLALAVDAALVVLHLLGLCDQRLRVGAVDGSRVEADVLFHGNSLKQFDGLADGCRTARRIEERGVEPSIHDGFEPHAVGRIDSQIADSPPRDAVPAHDRLTSGQGHYVVVGEDAVYVVVAFESGDTFGCDIRLPLSVDRIDAVTVSERR